MVALPEENFVDLETAPSCANYLHEWTMYEILEDAAIKDFSKYLGMFLHVLTV